MGLLDPSRAHYQDLLERYGGNLDTLKTVVRQGGVDVWGVPPEMQNELAPYIKRGKEKQFEAKNAQLQSALDQRTGQGGSDNQTVGTDPRSIAESALQSAQITPDQRQRMITSRRDQLSAELQSATGNIDPNSGVQRGGVQRTAEGYGVASANLNIQVDQELAELNRLLAGTASGIDVQGRGMDLQEEQFDLQKKQYRDDINKQNAELQAQLRAAQQDWITGGRSTGGSPVSGGGSLGGGSPAGVLESQLTSAGAFAPNTLTKEQQRYLSQVIQYKQGGPAPTNAQGIMYGNVPDPSKPAGRKEGGIEYMQSGYMYNAPPLTPQQVAALGG